MAIPDDRPDDDPPSRPRRAGRDQSAWDDAWEGAKETLFVLILLAVLVALGVVVFRVITTDASLRLIPTSSESAALIRANERVVQLTQWTISTILIVAGGLIGLNWYQNQRRYERDKEELDAFRVAISDEVAGLRSSLAARIQHLERQSEALAEQHRDHVLVQAVDDIASASSPAEALRSIMSWYDRLRAVDDAAQSRALTLVWQGWDIVVQLLRSEARARLFHSEADRQEFMGFLERVNIDYPELEEYVEAFREIATRR